MKFHHHARHKHARRGIRRRCVVCGARTLADQRVRYCGKHTRSKGTRIKAYEEAQQAA